MKTTVVYKIKTDLHQSLNRHPDDFLTISTLINVDQSLIQCIPKWSRQVSSPQRDYAISTILFFKDIRL